MCKYSNNELNAIAFFEKRIIYIITLKHLYGIILVRFVFENIQNLDKYWLKSTETSF